MPLRPGMTIVGVDLAAKFSAACWLWPGYQVHDQYDSWQATRSGFIDDMTAIFDHGIPRQPGCCADLLVVEDLPARVPWMGVVKDVCRLQGRIAERMIQLAHIDRLVFVQPETWRSHYTGLERGTGPDAVVPVAAGFGYTPPDLTDRIGKGEKATARKVQTDYCAAYLIARWASDFYSEHGHLDAPRTSRFTSV